MTARDSDSVGAWASPGGGLLERQFEALAHGLPRFVWVSTDGGHWTWSCPRWTAYTGLSAEASLGLGWYAAVHPGDRAAVEAAWRAAPAQGVLEAEHRLLARDGGEVRRFRVHGTPLPEAPGRAREWFGTCTETTGPASDPVPFGPLLGGRRAKARRDRSAAELHRSICDVLALTRLIARRAAKAGTEAEEFAQHLEGFQRVTRRTPTQFAHDVVGGDAGRQLEPATGPRHSVIDVLAQDDAPAFQFNLQGGALGQPQGITHRLGQGDLSAFCNSGFHR